MGLFQTRKPRRFHHEYIYAGRRGGRHSATEESAEAAPGKDGILQPAASDRNEKIRGMFLGATKHARRRNERRQAGNFVLSYGVIIVLLVVLAAIWKMLLSL